MLPSEREAIDSAKAIIAAADESILRKDPITLEDVRTFLDQMLASGRVIEQGVLLNKPEYRMANEAFAVVMDRWDTDRSLMLLYLLRVFHEVYDQGPENHALACHSCVMKLVNEPLIPSKIPQVYDEILQSAIKALKTTDENLPHEVRLMKAFTLGIYYNALLYGPEIMAEQDVITQESIAQDRLRFAEAVQQYLQGNDVYIQ